MSKLDEILDAHSVVCYDAADKASYDRASKIIDDCRKVIETALKLEELMNVKIENIKKHLENIERQQMTGRNLGDKELDSGDYMIMADTKLKLELDLKQYQSLIEESKK